MPAEITAPVVVERGPYCIVGCYAVYEGDDEGPGWYRATVEFQHRRAEVGQRVGDTLFGFLYRPHRDDPSVEEGVRACFIGVEVTDAEQVPADMTVTRFSGGRFVTVECRAEIEDDTAGAVGDAVGVLERWVRDHGYREGDSCLCFSHESEARPPYVEHVQMKFEEGE